MEQERIAFEILLGKERILIGNVGGEHMKKFVWNEARHCNADWELHLILKGSSKIDVEDQHYVLKKGQAILIAPGRYHKPEALPGEFERFSIAISLPKSALSQALSDKVPVGTVLDPGEELMRLASEIYRENASLMPFSQEYKEALTTQFLVVLFRLLHLGDEKKSTVGKTYPYNVTSLIDDYFEHHFADQAGEEDLAALLHLSRRQLVRILQEIYGMNFRQKLIRTRMDYAAWLLRTTDKKVSEIIGTVGYSSEAAFFQVFRKYFAMSPQKYRSKKRNSK